MALHGRGRGVDELRLCRRYQAAMGAVDSRVRRVRIEDILASPRLCPLGCMD